MHRRSAGVAGVASKCGMSNTSFGAFPSLFPDGGAAAVLEEEVVDAARAATALLLLRSGADGGGRDRKAARRRTAAPAEATRAPACVWVNASLMSS